MALETSGFAQSLRDAHASKMAQLDSLEAKLKSFDGDREELHVLCRQVDEKEKERVNFRKLIDQLCKGKGELDKVSTRERDLNSPLQYDATLERKLFEKTMGLEIKLTEDRLISLGFKHLSKEEPQLMFRVVLDISAEEKWEVVSLDPHIHGVGQLLHDLNQSGDVTQFCKAFRTCCKQHILTTSQP